MVCLDDLSLGYYRRGLLRPRFDIDHASHVSFYSWDDSLPSVCSWRFPALPFGIGIKLLWPSLPSYGSPTWGISFQASLISLSPVNLNEYDLTSGIAKVNDRFQSFGLLALFISRFTLYGCPPQEHAQIPILRPSKPSPSTRWSPILLYYSSCSLA